MKVGDRIVINGHIGSVGYIQARKFYANCVEGMTGKILGFTQAGDKAGVEFDQIVFFDHEKQGSSHDNGCLGLGKLHYCWYIPTKCLDLDDGYTVYSTTITEDTGISYYEKLLLV